LNETENIKVETTIRDYTSNQRGSGKGTVLSGTGGCLGYDILCFTRNPY